MLPKDDLQEMPVFMSNGVILEHAAVVENHDGWHVVAVSLKARRATVRSMLPGSVYIAIDPENIHIVGQPHFGMPHAIWHLKPQARSLQHIMEEAKYDIGFTDPYGMSIPRNIANISRGSPERTLVIRAIAAEYVSSEVRRQNMLQNIVQINPIFGSASYQVRGDAVFALMPFNEEMDEIYKSKLKPCFEDDLKIAIHRADELKNVNVIMHDIWKSICEARLVIADLTGFNPNVMYELGIAHTVGKETIIMHQRKKNETVKFPFDLAHIRRIDYENTMAGGEELIKRLKETVQSILDARVEA